MLVNQLNNGLIVLALKYAYAWYCNIYLGKGSKFFYHCVVSY